MSMDLATIGSYISIGKDVTVAFAAIVTARVAVVGLRKWRDELRGKAHFEAARNLQTQPASRLGELLPHRLQQRCQSSADQSVS